MADEKTVAPHNGNNAEVERLRAEIESTRVELGHTIDQIQERLSPARLKQEAKDSVREATIGRVKQMAKNAGDKAGDTGRGIFEVMRDNPLPVAMIGLGAGWLIMNSRKRNESHSALRILNEQTPNDRTPLGYESAYVDGRTDVRAGLADRSRGTVSDAAHSLGERVSDVSSSVKSTASDVAERVSEVASDVSERVGEKLSHVSDTGERQLQRARYTYEETPWVGAAVALALGAAAGLSIPSTRREQELLGDKRDELMDRARDTAREKLEAVRTVAEGVIDDMKPVAERSLKDHAREEGLMSDSDRISDSGSGTTFR